MLHELQRDTFLYFLELANPRNGLAPDSDADGSPASIAVVGFALGAYPVAVERGLMSRRAAARRTLKTLEFFWNSPHSAEPDATGYKGFYYHFLDMQTGRRVWQCELSTIDTALLMAGVLAARVFFDEATEEEAQIRELAEVLYRRVDWRWATDGGVKIRHGWTPERGFLSHCWEGYDEALLLHVLGLGSPTHPLSEETYAAWTSTFQWRQIYGHELLQAGPLFIHQQPAIWLDLRGVQDDYMRGKSIDYFENSRRATYAQQQYAIDNPRGFRDYHRLSWGLTATQGPGPARREVDGVERHFLGYGGRGVPDGPDDGTLSPWSVVASLPFAPEIVLPALDYFAEHYPRTRVRYGFRASFNPTFVADDGSCWVSPRHLGLNQGPNFLMVENFRTGLIWRLTRHCRYIATGLRRAHFAGGWLGGKEIGNLATV
jgi:hypothetical protein